MKTERERASIIHAIIKLISQLVANDFGWLCHYVQTVSNITNSLKLDTDVDKVEQKCNSTEAKTFSQNQFF